MHNHPNPNDLDGALMLLGAAACLIFAGMLWIDSLIERKKERQRQAVEEAREQAGAEAYVHPYTIDGNGTPRAEPHLELLLMREWRDRQPKTEAELDDYIERFCRACGVPEHDEQGRRKVMQRVRSWCN